MGVTSHNPQDGGSERKKFKQNGTITYAVESDAVDIEAAKIKDGKIYQEYRHSIQSNPTEPLPQLEIPGQQGAQQDDCGDDIPVAFCSDCGKPYYGRRACRSPVCSECWESWATNYGRNLTNKAESRRRERLSELKSNKNLYHHHLVVSPPPGIRYDSEKPLERALETVKVLLSHQFQVHEGIVAYHPWRIKEEYRGEVNGHDSGDGNMTWSDIYNKENPRKYLYFSPHFHVICTAEKIPTEHVASGVYNRTGWVVHRITQQDSNVSLYDLEDLASAIIYSLSHTGIKTDGERAQPAVRMWGGIHNANTFVDEEAAQAAADASSRTLNVAVSGPDSCTEKNTFTTTNRTVQKQELDDDHSLFFTKTTGPSTSSSSSTSTSTEVVTENQEQEKECDGDIIPINRAKELLDDDDWVEEAPHADALKRAYDRWQTLEEDESITSGVDPPA